MKRIFLSAAIICVTTAIATAQKIRFNAYTAYVFDDAIESYYSPSSYYNGTIQGGFQWGLGLEYMIRETKGIELKYLRQDTHIPLNYYDVVPKSKVFDMSVNYILIGGSNYFRTARGTIEPYGGFGIGASIIDIKNPAVNGISSRTDFAWDLKLGTNIWAGNGRVGLKLQVELLSAVQSVGTGFYFGTGGTGAGVSTYSSMIQFGVGGGLTFKMSK